MHNPLIPLLLLALCLFSAVGWGRDDDFFGGAEDCVYYVARMSDDKLLPFFLLPPGRTRILTAVRIELLPNIWIYGFGDYLSGHEYLFFNTAMLESDDHHPVRVSYAGEVAVVNRSSQTAMGQIEFLNDTSGFVFDAMGRQAKQPGRTRFENDAEGFKRELLRLAPQLIRSDAKIFSALDRLHLVDGDPGDIRHDYLGELRSVRELAKLGADLPSQLVSVDGRDFLASDFERKSRWLSKHVATELDEVAPMIGTLPDLLSAWRHGKKLRQEDRDAILLGLVQIDAAIKRLADRVLLIEGR